MSRRYGTRPEIHAAHAGLVRHVGKRAIAVVVIEDVLAVLRDVKIGEAIVIVVAPDAAQAIGVARHAGLLRDVRERAVAVVVVERVAGRDAALVEIAAVDEIDVLVAVAVEIRHANPGPASSRMVEVSLAPLKCTNVMPADLVALVN